MKNILKICFYVLAIATFFYFLPYHNQKIVQNKSDISFIVKVETKKVKKTKDGGALSPDTKERKS